MEHYFSPSSQSFQRSLYLVHLPASLGQSCRSHWAGEGPCWSKVGWSQAPCKEFLINKPISPSAGCVLGRPFQKTSQRAASSPGWSCECPLGSKRHPYWRFAKGHTLASCQHFVEGNVTLRDVLCSNENFKVRKLSILPTHRIWHSQIYCGSGIHDMSSEFTLAGKKRVTMIRKSLSTNSNFSVQLPHTGFHSLKTKPVCRDLICFIL